MVTACSIQGRVSLVIGIIIVFFRYEFFLGGFFVVYFPLLFKKQVSSFLLLTNMFVIKSEFFRTSVLGHLSILFRLTFLISMEKVLSAYEDILQSSYCVF